MASPLAVPDAWNLVAPEYDELIVPLFRPFSERAIALLDLPESARVLDVACGPGTTTELLLERGHEVHAVDFASNMVAMLERRVQRLDPTQRAKVRPRVMDGQALAFEDAHFHGAVSMFGLMFFPDRQKGFAELHRVLRPGGRACVSSWLPMASVPLMQWGFGAFAAITPPPPADAPPRLSTLEDPELFAREMTQAGFDDVRIERYASPAGVNDVDGFWDHMVRSSAPIRLFRSRLSDAEWAPLNEKALRFLHDHRPDDLEALTMDAWIGAGVKR